MSPSNPLASGDFQAVLFDLDGVLTATAKVHAAAWKQMFDAFLQTKAEFGGPAFQPFDLERDYKKYVDGKPRYDGVRSFLQARGVDLPEGDPKDAPGRPTVCGLGNRKNELIQQVLKTQGVEVYPDALRFLEWLRQAQLKTAVVSSSNNCQLILRTVGLQDQFDARVDGKVAAELNLPGKPMPDTFLQAAQQLGVVPPRAVVVEDALAGVQAGKAGRFGLVIGVARSGESEALRQAGADLVVTSLDELM